MKRKPWYKHDANDWLSDPLLKRCSLAAQGLLERIMCMAHNGEPYGHVILSGVVFDASLIAEECGKRPSSVRVLLTELEKNGRISYGTRGELVIKRMVQDHQYSLQQSELGKQGGNPTLKAPLKVDSEKETRERERKDNRLFEEWFERAWITYGRYGSKKKAKEYARKYSPEDLIRIEKAIPDYLEVVAAGRSKKQFEGWINPTHRLWDQDWKQALVEWQRGNTGTEKSSPNKTQTRNRIMPGDRVP